MKNKVKKIVISYLFLLASTASNVLGSTESTAIILHPSTQSHVPLDIPVHASRSTPPLEILGLTTRKNYSKSEIDRAYRKQMLKYHPDKHILSPYANRYQEFSKLVNSAREAIYKSHGWPLD